MNIKLTENDITSAEWRYFISIYEEKSLIGASRKLSIDSGYLSRLLAQLEASSGSKLFLRHKYGMKPTAQADLIYSSLKEVQNQFKEKIQNQDYKKKMKIGFSATIGYHYLKSEFIKKLNEDNIQVQFEIKNSTELIEKIKLREIDLVLIAREVNNPSLISKKLASENLSLYSLSGQPTANLVINPETIGLDRIISDLSFTNRWNVDDYFVLAKLITLSSEMMGVLPSSFASHFNQLKEVKKFKNLIGVGHITALTWSGSNATKYIKFLS